MNIRFNTLNKQCLIAVTILLLPAMLVNAAKLDNRYYKKAEFLVNFALYTYWPDEAFVNAQESINICLYGYDPFGSLIDELVNERRYSPDNQQYRSLSVWRLASAESLDGCHIVFVPEQSMHSISLLNPADDYRLLVGETLDFALGVGQLNLYSDDQDLLFEVNIAALQATKLQLSAQLLRLATIVSNH